MEDFTLLNKAITIVGKRNCGKSQITSIKRWCFVLQRNF